MTLLFVDSFDLLATADLPLKYFSVGGSGIVTSPGRFSPGNKYRSSAGFTNNFSTGVQPGTVAVYLQPSKITLAVGVAINISNISASGTAFNGRLITLLDSAGNDQLTVWFDPSSQLISVYRGSVSTLLCTSSTPVVLGAWVYLEILVTISPTTGSVTLRQNAQSVATFSGNTQQTALTNVQQVVVGCRFGMSIGNSIGSANYSVDFDDFYICDTNGSVNNAFLGDVRVTGLLPNGAGTNTNLTIGGSSPAATNFGSVNQNPQDNDVTFVSSNVVGTTDTYTYGSLPASASLILAVVSTPVARKDDAGSRSLSTRVRSGGTEADSPTSAPLLSTYTIPEIIMETNPVTSVAWTPTTVNTAQFGPKVAS